MKKKTLLGIILALLALTFIFLFVGIFAAGLAMTILGLIFTFGSIVCLVVYLTSSKSQ